ncbi:MAG: DUF4919 domain-containing protein [Planctomycetota bacterium]
MFDQFAEFVDEPTRQNFMALRRMLIKHESYRPYSNPLAPLQQAADSEDWEGLLQAVPSAMPGMLLSARLHMLASIAHEKLGHEEDAMMEKMLYQRCLEGIRLTGQGTEEQPWLVLRVSDEYDVLFATGRTLERQSLVSSGERKLDHLVCTDGSEVWFDVTDMLMRGIGD